jgi:2,4-dienoyl-CoA reductase-like NADH-dependent reductase (Old Yellow Enzyme family)
MRHFVYKSLDELRQAAESLGAEHVRFEANPEAVRRTLARPVQAGPFRAGNSLAIHPMEGCDGTTAGAPDELTWRRYLRFARGGAKLVWFEATAVREDGRANTRQLWLYRDTVSEFARLLDAMRREHREQWGTADDLLIPVQLTHSGRYSHPRPVIAYHNPHIDRKAGTPADLPPITDDELERLEDVYVEAARLAVEAGFQAADIKATHGYLLSELLGAKTRAGSYGGPLENRLRFIRNVAGKIRAAVGDRLLLCVRLGCFDCVPYFRDPATGLGVPCDYEVPYPYGFGVDPNDPLRPDLTEVKQALFSISL